MTTWEKSESWLTPGRFALVLAAMVLIQFPGVVLGFDTFFFRDYGFFGYPLAQYHRDAFWSGEIPFWNPYNNAGLPFLAQWNTMVLYPGSLIYLLLPMPWSLGIFCLFHQFLAGLGMYFLGRDSAKSNLAGAIAGIAFAFSGLLLCSLKWPNNIAAFGLMPWVVWRCWRATTLRTLGIAALVGAAQMLSGAPEVILLTWGIIGVMTLGESIAQRSSRPLLFLVAIVALVSMIAAAQLWPFLDLLKLSQRTEKFAGSDWPMPIWGWANFILPLFGTFPSYHGVPAQPDQYWISTYYVPLAAVALIPWGLREGWRPRVLLGLAVLGAWMALGEAGGIYSGLRHVFPGLGFMRFPIKFVILTVFLLPWVGSFGIGAMTRGKVSSRTILATLVILGVVILTLGNLHPATSVPMPGMALNISWRLCFTTIALFAIAEILEWKVVRMRLALLLIALWLDARTQAPEQNPTAPKWVFDRGLPQIKNQPRLGFGRAMIGSEAALKLDHLIREKPEEDIGTSRLALFCNDNLIDRIPKVDGFFSLYPRESAQLIDFIYANTNRDLAGLEKTLCVTHRTLPGKTGEWSDGAPRPMVFGVAGPYFADRAETFSGMLAPEFDPAKTVYLPPEARTKVEATGRAEIENLNWTPGRVTFTAVANAPAWVFISQAYHPGWSEASGLKIERADFAFQAVFVPAGRTNVELKYREPHFFAGLIISLCGVLSTVFLLFKRP